MFYKIKGKSSWRWFHMIFFIVVSLVVTIFLLAGVARIFWHSSLFLKMFAREAAFMMSSSKEFVVELQEIHTHGFINVSLKNILVKTEAQDSSPFLIKELILDYDFNPFNFDFFIRGTIVSLALSKPLQGRTLAHGSCGLRVVAEGVVHP